ncbi:MAG TPA: hypothetical protein EYG71_07255 [Leucothrix sp.]|nr:hypothetical protein [Leucothrix sp.]
MDNVSDHLHEIDVNLYQDLLSHSSKDMNNVAKNFMSGSQEIKRIMSNYQKKWCKKKKLSIGAKHEIFLKETSEMFELVLLRLQNEMEHLYPAVREISS